jgi:hypothetical protein
MQTLYELLVRSATLPALHTNNGGKVFTFYANALRVVGTLGYFTCPAYQQRRRYNYATTGTEVCAMPTAA